MSQNKKDKNYAWSGRDKKGNHVSGETMGASEAIVKVSLRNREIYVDKIKVKRVSSGKSIKAADIAVFTRQLYSMSVAGLPLLGALQIISDGHPNPSMSRLINSIKAEVQSGSSLADSFAKHPQYFDKLYCNLIEAGEVAGILDTILERLAIYQEKTMLIKKKIKKALMYPLSVLGISFGVTAVIMLFVIPSFKSVFDSLGAQLPAPTLLVIALSDAFTKYWYIIFGSIFLFFWGFAQARKRSVKFDQNIQKISLKLPLFGSILRKSAIARWCRTLSTMFAAGVPLVESLSSVANAAGNCVYEDATIRIQNKVSAGVGLTAAIQEQNLFPNLMIQMAGIGEESGNLDSMLDKVATLYENEVDEAVDGLSSLMEPLMIVFLGVLIGGLVVAMYLPLFKIGGAV